MTSRNGLRLVAALLGKSSAPAPYQGLLLRQLNQPRNQTSSRWVVGLDCSSNHTPTSAASCETSPLPCQTTATSSTYPKISAILTALPRSWIVFNLTGQHSHPLREKDNATPSREGVPARRQNRNCPTSRLACRTASAWRQPVRETRCRLAP
jgi:hypothetical protein